MAECGATISPATLLLPLVHIGAGGCAGLKASLSGNPGARECGQPVGVGDLAAIIGPDGLLVESYSLGDIIQPLPCDEDAPLMTLLAEVIAVDPQGNGSLRMWEDGEVTLCGDEPECDHEPLETMLRGCLMRLASNSLLCFRVALLPLGDAVACDETMPLETALRRCMRKYGPGQYALNLMLP